MTNRIETEALIALVEHMTSGPWGVYTADTPAREDASAEIQRLVLGTTSFSGAVHQVADFHGNCIAITGCGPAGHINACALQWLPDLAAEVLELRTALTAAAPAMAAMHSSAKEVWDEYEVIIDHLGDMVATRDTEIARLRADLESAREGRDYGC